MSPRTNTILFRMADSNLTERETPHFQIKGKEMTSQPPLLPCSFLLFKPTESDRPLEVQTTLECNLGAKACEKGLFQCVSIKAGKYMYFCKLAFNKLFGIVAHWQRQSVSQIVRAQLFPSDTFSSANITKLLTEINASVINNSSQG